MKKTTGTIQEMNYYKFVNQTLNVEHGIKVDKIYPGDTVIAQKKVSNWAKNESTSKDWELVSELEYYIQEGMVTDIRKSERSFSIQDKFQEIQREAFEAVKYQASDQHFLDSTAQLWLAHQKSDSSYLKSSIARDAYNFAEALLAERKKRYSTPFELQGDEK